MRATFVLALAATTVLLASPGDRAQAMPQPGRPALAGATTHIVQQVTVVCGNNGCGPVHTSRVKRRLTHP